MKIDSNVSMTGKLVIKLNDEVVREIDNLVVTAGKEWVASRMVGTSRLGRTCRHVKLAISLRLAASAALSAASSSTE